VCGAMSGLWFRGFVCSGVCGIALILGGCGSKGHSAVTGSAPSTASQTAAATGTSSESTTPALQTLRCPQSLTLPGPGDYAGQVTTVFIVASGPKESGCSYVTGWMSEWVKAGASPGGYAAGSLVGVRCDEPLLANQGPLGDKYSQYSGVIHCAQVDESAGDPEGQLDNDRAGYWGYYGSGSNPGPPAASSSAAGPAIPGSTLSKSLAKQLQTFADVQPDSVTCPALERKRGAKVTCNVSAKQTSGGTTELRGTADVTIQDQAGHRAEDTYELTGAGGAAIRGTGYPFDPDTGRVL
jgi:hypothetical protein